MTAAVTTIENTTGAWHTMPAPFQRVLAPGETVHSTITMANLATLYGCTVQALEGIDVSGVTRPALPIRARAASVGAEATDGLDDAPDFVGRDLSIDDITLDDATVDALVCASATVSGLTAGRVVIAGTGGLLADDADLTFATATLTATNLVATTAITQGASGSIAAGTGGISTTGDLSAVGGFRQQVGPFAGALAADQTDTVIRPAAVASAPGWVAQRAGSIVGFSAAISAALTGAGTTVAVSVRINGTIVAATQLDFTQAGAETEDRYAVAKDVALHTFAAGDNIDVVYTSTTITNTPAISAWIEVEQ